MEIAYDEEFFTVTCNESYGRHSAYITELINRLEDNFELRLSKQKTLVGGYIIRTPVKSGNIKLLAWHIEPLPVQRLINQRTPVTFWYIQL